MMQVRAHLKSYKHLELAISIYASVEDWRTILKQLQKLKEGHVMAKPPSWRDLEAALVRVTRAYGHAVDQPSDSGDKIIHEVLLLPDSDTVDDLNLTEFAKDLAKELER